MASPSASHTDTATSHWPMYRLSRVTAKVSPSTGPRFCTTWRPWVKDTSNSCKGDSAAPAGRLAVTAMRPVAGVSSRGKGEPQPPASMATAKAKAAARPAWDRTGRTTFERRSGNTALASVSTMDRGGGGASVRQPRPWALPAKWMKRGPVLPARRSEAARSRGWCNVTVAQGMEGDGKKEDLTVLLMTSTHRTQKVRSSMEIVQRLRQRYLQFLQVVVDVLTDEVSYRDFEDRLRQELDALGRDIVKWVAEAC